MNLGDKVVYCGHRPEYRGRTGEIWLLLDGRAAVAFTAGTPRTIPILPFTDLVHAR